jgi:hypothetical protein
MGRTNMAEHDQPPASKLARGPAKPEDIDRIRHDLDERSPTARAERTLTDVEAASETIRRDVDELKRVIESERRRRV